MVIINVREWDSLINEIEFNNFCALPEQCNEKLCLSNYKLICSLVSTPHHPFYQPELSKKLRDQKIRTASTGKIIRNSKWRQIYVPNNKEVVAINVPWLHSVFWILKNNLSVTSEISSHDRSLEVSTTASGIVRNASGGKNSLDVEVVG